MYFQNEPPTQHGAPWKLGSIPAGVPSIKQNFQFIDTTVQKPSPAPMFTRLAVAASTTPVTTTPAAPATPAMTPAAPVTPTKTLAVPAVHVRQSFADLLYESIQRGAISEDTGMAIASIAEDLVQAHEARAAATGTKHLQLEA